MVFQKRGIINWLYCYRELVIIIMFSVSHVLSNVYDILYSVSSSQASKWFNTLQKRSLALDIQGLSEEGVSNKQYNRRGK